MSRSRIYSWSAVMFAVAVFTATAQSTTDRFPPTTAIPDGWVVSPGANNSWLVTNTTASEGLLSLKAAQISDGQTAGIEFWAVTGIGNFTFSRKVSSEFGFDKFRFFLNGNEIASAGATGDSPWTVVSVPIRAGRNNFRFVYEKDSAVSVGQDTAWIDDIQFPAKTVLRAPNDINGDGKSDILLTYVGGGIFSYFMNGAQVAGGRFVTPVGTALKPIFFADLDGDSRSDVLFQSPDGTLSVGIPDATGKLAVSELPFGTNWIVKQVGDFNGDSKDDLVLGAKVSNGFGDYIALMDGPIAPAGNFVFQSLSSLGGDFTGDGKRDAILDYFGPVVGGSNITTGFGVSPFRAFTLGPALDSAWTPIHVVDINGDGKVELISRQNDGTTKVIFDANTPSFVETIILGPTNDWTLTHVTDTNGDSKPDFVYKHTNGSIFVYLMNGTTILGGAYILGSNTGWRIAQVGDYNGDGKSDFLLRHADGSLYVYIMSGANVASGSLILGPGTGWAPVP